MPWFAVPAALAFGGLVGKLVARHLRGQAATRALEDPPGVRTVARFELAPGGELDELLLAVAAELARGFDRPVEVTGDAVRARAHPLAADTDIVRLGRRAAGGCYTLELTRAWTGAELDDLAHAQLQRIHAALVAHPHVRALTWHSRQDRELQDGFAMPVFVQTAAVR